MAGRGGRGGERGAPASRAPTPARSCWIGGRWSRITAFLFANGGHEDPKQLAANAGKSFQGSIVLGMGFTFDDSGPADDVTPGIPSPIATMERLIAENPKNAEVIFPYIGGEEVNSSPTHAHHRYVINFGERSEEECRREWPELMAIVERKVKPERDSSRQRDGRRASITGGSLGDRRPRWMRRSRGVSGCW